MSTLDTPDGSLLHELLSYGDVMSLAWGQQKGDQFALAFRTYV
jgi:hypothetical protein